MVQVTKTAGLIITNIEIRLGIFTQLKIKLLSDAHPQSQITRLAWVDNETLVSVGQDCNTKLWTITPF